MALTRVSRHIIDEPLELQNINSTGIGTFASLRVTGDLQVDGTTTTLDTIVTEVDKLEVGANNNTVGVAITQSGTGDIFNLYDGPTEVFSVRDGGNVGIKNATGISEFPVDVGGEIASKNSSKEFIGINLTNNEARIRSSFYSGASGAYRPITFYTSDAERLRITSDGKVGIGTDVPGSKLHVDSGTDSVVGKFVSSNTSSAVLELDSLASNYTELKLKKNGTVYGNLQVAFNDVSLVQQQNANLRFYTNNTERLRILAGGSFDFKDNSFTNVASIALDYIKGDADDDTNITFAGNDVITFKAGSTSPALTVNTTQVKVEDNQRFVAGTGNDLQIHHNGNNSIIEHDGTGNLYVQTTGSGEDLYLQANDNILIRPQGGENGITVTGNAGVELYYDNSKKLETTGAGVTITGIATAATFYAEGGTYAAGTDTATDAAIVIEEEGSIYTKDGVYLRNLIQKKSDVIIIGQQNTSFTDAIELKPGVSGSVKLHYGAATDNVKLETTTTGAKVTGALEVTQEYPSIRPTLDLNFAATKTLDRRITFTRDSLGTYTDELGIVRTASNNTPRFDHDPVTGESLGLLIEESRTNISKQNVFRQSNANRFSINSTNEQRLGENTGGVVGPDGSEIGVLRMFFTGSESDPNGSVYVFAGENTSDNTYTTTNTHTSSVWIRPGLETVWKMQAHSNYAASSAGGSPDTIDFIFTLTGDGTVTSIESGGIAASVTKYSNNWYRCTITYHRNSNATVNSSYAVIAYPNVYASYNSQSQTGDIGWLWGPQVEEGSFPTSYIPTSGSTVTRAVDTAIIRGTNFTDWYNSSASTLFMEGKLSGAISTGQYPFVAFEVESNNNRNNSFAITRRSGQGVRAVNYDSSGTQDIDITSSAWDGGSFKKFAYALDDSGSSSVLVDDGTVVGTDTSYATTSLSSVDILRFANHLSGGMTNFNVTIKSFKYYNKRLPNAQLQGLTQQ